MTKLVNRAKMTTASTGTGSPITLGSAVDGYQTFAAAGVADADVVRYVIEDGDAWEISTGTYTATGTTLSRTLVESSTGSLLNLSGNAVVYVIAAAQDIQQPPAEGAFVDGDKTKLDGIEAGATADQTASEIKTAYESNADTNAFTDAEQTKLAGIEAGADVTDAGNVNPLVDAHLNYSSATTGQVLSYNGSDYDWVTVSGYTDADVDTHLNTGTASAGEVLSWTGSDYDWVSGGATSINGLSDGYSAGQSVGLGSFALNEDDGTLNRNTAVGYQAGRYIAGGTYNVALGHNALLGDSTSKLNGLHNVGIGYGTGFDLTTGSYNTLICTGAGANITTGNYNVGLGWNALNGSSAAGFTGSNNVGIGYQTGVDLSTGTYNFLGGYQAGTNLTTGSNNVAIGNGALDAATTGGRNIAIGQNAMGSGVATDASGDNIAIGVAALFNVTSGRNNIALGQSAGALSNIARDNVFIGRSSGGFVSSGFYNVLLGTLAGDTLTTGNNNVVIGYNADASSATVSNEITLGNSSITTLRCQVTTITSLSDARDKTDIQPLNAGLEFVEALNPVSFTWNMRDGGKVGEADTGFIAQDLQKAQADTGVSIPGLVYDVNPDKLEAGYGKLVPVLVQAIKDLSAKVDELEARLEGK